MLEVVDLLPRVNSHVWLDEWFLLGLCGILIKRVLILKVALLVLGEMGEW